MRFDWANAGAQSVGADVDVIVIVDVLPATAVDRNEGAGQIVARLRAREHATIVEGSLRNRTAIAQWVLKRQAEKAGRFTVAVIAAGETREDGSIRFAVEDQLGAGAIIDALANVGIDYCSPEAAVACASFTGLRTAVGHLISASASGKELLERGSVREIDFAADVDASTEVLVLEEYEFPSRG